MQNPKQPIRSRGMFEILRAIKWKNMHFLVGIQLDSEKKEKERIKQK